METPRSTRMVADAGEIPPEGEQADFDEMLEKFKHGLAQNMDADDYGSHYDLGIAFREMGLLDEAIAEFQKALRGREHRVATYEALGQCFVDKRQYEVAVTVLQRALREPGFEDERGLGVLYLLGLANERMVRHAEAARYYQRVFSVDINFRDITDRLSAVAQAAG
jgi:tetratricopeptide (TPR) repeat protein